MKAYIYQAELYCEACGEDIKANIAPPDGHEYGPFGDGGGEADTPQYCGRCGLFLENPLTKDGRHYVLEHIVAAIQGRGDPCLSEWLEFYKEDVIQAIEECIGLGI